jgi:hypothetical protein
MSEEIITTKRGSFGRVQVTLPMPVKNTMMKWIRNSGLGKAEFLRMALMIGAAETANNLLAKRPEEGYYTDKSGDVPATAQR